MLFETQSNQSRRLRSPKKQSLIASRVSERDAMLDELNRNNALLRQPIEEFWTFILEYVSNNSLAFVRDNGALQRFYKLMQKETDYSTYLCEEKNLQAPMARYLYTPEPFEKDIDNFRQIIPAFFDNLEMTTKLQNDKMRELRPLQKRNSELLTKLCAIDLEMRLGKEFKGIYPNAGLDCDLVYRLGGEWLLLEPGFPQDEYTRRLKTETKHGEYALDQKRTQLYRSETVGDAQASQQITNFNPDVIMLKGPGPCTTYEKLAIAVSNAITRTTLVITETELTLPDTRRITDIVGIKGLKGLSSEVLNNDGGSLCYPFYGFNVYEIQPPNQ